MTQSTQIDPLLYNNYVLTHNIIILSKQLFNVYKLNLLDDTNQIYKNELFIIINQMIQECWNIYNEHII